MPTTNAERKRKYNASRKGRATNKKYRSSARHAKLQKVYDAKQRSTPDGVLKYKARYTVNNAVRWGRLHKLPCQVCGVVKVQAHHDDYREPLMVTWLCEKHHRELHRRNICA